MKIYHVETTILFLLLCTTTSPLQAESKIQCWTNEDGITECGNYVPPQYSQQGFAEFNTQGIKTKEVDRAPTPEEIAEFEKKKEEERQRQEQIKKDRALLALFSTERDIQLARSAILNSIDGQINGIETILEGLRGNLADLEESYERSKNNASVSESQLQAIQRNINNVKKRIQDTEETLQKKQNERQKANEEYDTYVQRYQDIMKRGGVPPKPEGEEKEEEN